MKRLPTLFVAGLAAACKPAPVPLTAEVECDRAPDEPAVVHCRTRCDLETRWTLLSGTQELASNMGGREFDVDRRKTPFTGPLTLKLEKGLQSLSLPVSLKHTAWYDASVSGSSSQDGQTLRVVTAPDARVSFSGKALSGKEGTFEFKPDPLELEPLAFAVSGKMKGVLEVKSPEGDTLTREQEFSTSLERIGEIRRALTAFPKTPLPWARPYQPDKRPRPGYYLHVHAANELVLSAPPINGTPTMGQVEIVALSDESTRVLESCGKYARKGGIAGVGTELKRSRTDLVVDVYEAATGKKLGSKRFIGPTPRPCPEHVKVDDVSLADNLIYSPAPDMKPVLEWLTGY